MGRKSHTSTLYCLMNGYLVGELRQKQGRLCFQYAPSWLNTEGSRAISLSIPLQAEEIRTNAVTSYFDNLLPDNDKIRQRIVDRLGAQSTSTFDLLAQIGGDCVGALELTKTPPETSLSNSTQPSIKTLAITPLSEAEIAQQVRNSRTNNTLGMDSNDDFRISLAGAQEKTALTLWQGKWHKPHSKTPTTHIFKPPIYHHENMGLNLSSSVDNEWFCLTFLRHLGIPTASAEIHKFEDQKVLVVARFDRKTHQEQILRLPQEDMCQALGRSSGSKYEEHGGPSALDIMNVLKLSKHTITDREYFFKTQLAFWLLAAIDGHAKNFSIFLQANGFCLTPLYDVMSAYPYFSSHSQGGNIQKQKVKMAMKVHSKNTHYRWNDIQKRHWYSHGKYLVLSENTVGSIIANLTSNVEPALEKTFTEASELFDENVGSQIAEMVGKTLLKLH
ncbi:type II toxin-antitoxin system HipA family toxin [Alteromonas sp. a30]|uniref:type II toxin-antitoxin system HipA family toxin n=1 Tax=Alteromonas sp. a30 TaxID=2730917 RepID=UPI0022831022|nr:type II toxin-antitoxin system HipA family toxin [Alteromonas sp. a30]MCY7297195.1 type II toxin-antitoxin system HipA family toxin [Alteromonas sp. a30]